MRFPLLIGLFAMLAAGCAPTQSATQPPPDVSSEPIAGGFATADDEDEWTKAAKDLAIDAVYDKYPTRALVSRVTSEVQVVAGLNYRFVIEMSGSTDYRSSTSFKDAYEVVVYRDLEGVMEVTRLRQVRGR
ncbi:MAG: hypothetical protein AAGB25_03130 [Pseudomonadota bacterium]